jgi:hypothetical protein
MARAVFTRHNGIPRIHRARRWRWAAALALVGTFMLLPLALSLVVALPPLLFAVPPLAAGLGVWWLFHELTAEERRAASSADRPCTVITLRPRAPAWRSTSGPPGR